MRRGSVFDNPVLSHYFPIASFPVWSNHRNLKNFLSYKNIIFEQDLPNREYKDYIFQSLIDQSLRNARRQYKSLCTRFFASVIGQFTNQFACACCFLLFKSTDCDSLSSWTLKKSLLRERKLCPVIQLDDLYSLIQKFDLNYK